MSETLSLGAEFPAASRDEWVAAAEKVLKGKSIDSLRTVTYDDIVIEPLYTADEALDPGLPGQAPYVRHTQPLGTTPDGWDVRQRFAHPDPAVNNAAILDGLGRGVTSLLVRVDDAADLARMLEGVMLHLAPVALDAAHATEHSARALVSLWQEAGIAPAEARGAFRMDPLGLLATSGALRSDLAHSYEHLLGVVNMTAGLFPGVTSIAVDATVHADAGASEADELAYSIASAVEYLRVLVDGGLSIDQACAQIEFTYSATADQFSTIAKLRAARRLWARVAEASGASVTAQAQRQHAVTSASMLTKSDPWVNALRTTIACLAAGVGGADVVTVAPLDGAVGVADDLALRMARNTQMLLLEESGLGHVVDPAGGAWYVESLTDQLAQTAWTRFQSIETAGGMGAHLLSGAVHQRVAEVVEIRERDAATRTAPITGVSEFPDLDEQPLDRVAEAPRPAVENPKAEVAPLAVYRPAATYEALRDAARGRDDAKIFLANLGPLAVHTARTSWATNFFATGGIRAHEAGSFATAEEAAAAFAQSGCQVAVLCSSDKVYADLAEPAAKALKDAGATQVFLAGNPGDKKLSYVGAGIDGFVHVGVDAPAIVASVHRQLGIDEGSDA